MSHWQRKIYGQGEGAGEIRKPVEFKKWKLGDRRVAVGCRNERWGRRTSQNSGVF